MKRYDTVIIGSGFYAYGYAAVHENTLIIESSQTVETNYYGTLRGYDYTAKAPNRADTAKLIEHCKSLGVIKGDKLYVNALDVAISSFLTPNIPSVLLGSRVTGLNKVRGGYEIDLVNNEGRNRVFAQKVIVTERRKGEYLNVLIETDEILASTVDCQPAFFDNQYVIKLRIDSKEDINHIKLAAYNYLADALPSGAKVLQTAQFTYSEPIAPYTDDEGIVYVDEFYFGDPFSAYDMGGEQ